MWLILGPNNPLVALMVTGSTANLGLAAIPLALRVPARWYQVSQWERPLHLLLGVPVFGWLLDHSGWNRTVALPMRQLKITKTTLPRLLENIHAAEGAHAIAFVPHVALAMLALATGYVAGALWLLLPGIILHFYPVTLQRWMTLRVAPLLRRPEFHSPPANQRRGIGKAILESAMAHYQDLGATRFTLGATEEGFALYERLRFTTRSLPHVYVVGASTQFSGRS